MSYFAKVESGLVTNVISAGQDVIDSGLFGDPSQWIQTSYNTYGNVHYAPSPPAEPMTPDGGVALRGNYAAIGYTYDVVNDVFYAPCPGLGYTLNTTTWLWDPPTGG